MSEDDVIFVSVCIAGRFEFVTTIKSFTKTFEMKKYLPDSS